MATLKNSSMEQPNVDEMRKKLQSAYYFLENNRNIFEKIFSKQTLVRFEQSIEELNVVDKEIVNLHNFFDEKLGELQVRLAEAEGKHEALQESYIKEIKELKYDIVYANNRADEFEGQYIKIETEINQLREELKTFS